MSDEFLAEVQGLPHENLAVELLRKLLNDEIKLRSRRNIVEARSFKDLLERAIRRYALAATPTVRDVLGDEKLRTIARELVVKVRESASIDWTIKETVRAKMRAMVKRLLRRHGYPADQQEAATLIVLKQADLLCGSLAA
jgi:type I restriction enzyme R subunit